MFGDTDKNKRNFADIKSSSFTCLAEVSRLRRRTLVHICEFGKTHKRDSNRRNSEGRALTTMDPLFPIMQLKRHTDALHQALESFRSHRGQLVKVNLQCAISHLRRQPQHDSKQLRSVYSPLKRVLNITEHLNY